MSDDSDSDFGFGSSSPFLDDDEPSTTTQESVVVGACSVTTAAMMTTRRRRYSDCHCGEQGQWKTEGNQ